MELKKEYGSLSKLEELYANNKDNLKLYTDIEDWKYYSQNPEEILEDGKNVISDELMFGELELKIIETIKNKNPQSVNELSEMMGSNIGFIFPKVYQLVDYGVLELCSGYKKTLKPIFKYDLVKIES